MFVDFLKTSAVDYPGKVATVGFFSGCNLQCSYCHNHTLVNETDNSNFVDKREEFYAHLEKRRYVLDGIVFTGGETLTKNNFTILMEMLRHIKENMAMNISIKLDTNGMNPEALSDVLSTGYLNMVAIDVKTSPEIYRTVFNAPKVNPLVVSSALIKSLRYISEAKVTSQVRTTCVEEFASKEVLLPFLNALRTENLSFDSWLLNKPKLSDVLDPSVKMTAMTDKEMTQLASVIIRNGLTGKVLHNN